MLHQTYGAFPLFGALLLPEIGADFWETLNEFMVGTDALDLPIYGVVTVRDDVLVEGDDHCPRYLPSIVRLAALRASELFEFIFGYETASVRYGI